MEEKTYILEKNSRRWMRSAKYRKDKGKFKAHLLTKMQNANRS